MTEVLIVAGVVAWLVGVPRLMRRAERWWDDNDSVAGMMRRNGR